MAVTSRVNRRFRCQVTANEVIEVRTEDGVAWHYVFAFPGRHVSSRAGRPRSPASLSLCFETSGLALTTLVRPRAVGRIVQLLLAERATYAGNPAYVPWFWGLTRMVLPYGRQRPLREPLPGALSEPNPGSKVADRITREPVAQTLDPGWTGALAARQKMAMVRGSTGNDIPMW
jgi:hypothetical protein